MYRTTGFWSWIFRRVTGLGLAGYLLLHIFVISSVWRGGSQGFNDTMRFWQSPLFKLAEIGLLAAVLYHGLDGIRVLIVDLWGLTDKHRPLFWAVVGVGVVVFVIGAYPLLLFALQQRGG